MTETFGEKAVGEQQHLSSVMETLDGSELCFPQLLNSSCRRPKRQDFDAILTYILLSSISLLTAFLNLLVIISISHFRQLYTPTNIILLSLAVSDFLVGFCMGFHVMFISGCWLLGDLVCVIYQYLSFIITSASVGHMVLISVDRYVAICDPLHYSIRITHKRAEIVVCLCWIFFIVFQIVNLKDNLIQPGKFNTCIGEFVIVMNYIAGLIDVILTFILPIAVIVVLYTRVFMVAVSQARAMRSHVAAVKLQYSVGVFAKKSELKAARTLGVVIIVFLICLCPFYCVSLSGQEKSLNPSATAFVVFLVYLNSCLNPVIYALFYPWFRKSVKLTVTLKILQTDSCETNMM